MNMLKKLKTISVLYLCNYFPHEESGPKNPKDEAVCIAGCLFSDLTMQHNIQIVHMII